MSYVSYEDAKKLSRADLIVRLIENQTVARCAISEALTVGGNESEKRIRARIAELLPGELRETEAVS